MAIYVRAMENVVSGESRGFHKGPPEFCTDMHRLIKAGSCGMTGGERGIQKVHSQSCGLKFTPERISLPPFPQICGVYDSVLVTHVSMVYRTTHKLGSLFQYHIRKSLSTISYVWVEREISVWQKWTHLV